MLPSAALPDAVVPMKLPLNWLPELLPLMSTPLALLPEIRLPCGGRTKHGVRRIAAARRIVSARRLAADQVAGRTLRDQDAVLGIAQIDRAGVVGADVVHRDDVVAGLVERDAVAAVAADHVRQLKVRVDRRLERRQRRPVDHDADHRVAVHRVRTGDVALGALVILRSTHTASLNEPSVLRRTVTNEP